MFFLISPGEVINFANLDQVVDREGARCLITL